jgi:hypothetical protein
MVQRSVVCGFRVVGRHDKDHRSVVSPRSHRGKRLVTGVDERDGSFCPSTSLVT